MIKAWINYPGQFHDAIIMESGEWRVDRLGQIWAYEGRAANLQNPSKKGRLYTIPIRAILYIEDWGDESMIGQERPKQLAKE